MKKKLEAELISIAHRILKLKNKSDVVQLHQETQKLYEKLSVLRFVEENFSEAKPTIGQAEIEEKLESGIEYSNIEQQIPQLIEKTAVLPEPESEPEPEPESEPDPAPEEKDPDEEEIEIKEPEVPEEEKFSEMTEVAEKASDITTEKEPDEIIAEAEEEMQQDDAAEIKSEEPQEETESETPSQEDKEELFKPAFEWSFETKEEDKEPVADEKPEEIPAAEKPIEEKPATGQIAFDDLLGSGYTDPVFVKPEELAREKASWASEEKKAEAIPIFRKEDQVPVFKMGDNAEKPVSLNDRLSKGITVGLNDRIAFVKNLFANSNEDYNRVLSQLITFDTFEEAQEFIDNMVKPDYNNWEGKDEYAQRFMEVVEKKFS